MNLLLATILLAGGTWRNSQMPVSGPSGQPEIVTGYYVDSVNGSDSNSGTNPSAAFKTIAKVETIPQHAGEIIHLQTGSFWREQLTLTNSSVSVLARGAGAMPILDCSDVITNAWDKTPGYTYLYQLRVTNANLNTTAFVSMWENSNRLALVTSLANCDATNGTYYTTNYTSSPTTIFLHPSDNGDPNSNGKTYETAMRNYGLLADPLLGITNTVVSGIWTRRNLQNDGSLKLIGRATNCLATDGTKHNIYVGPNSYLYGCVASNAYYNQANYLFVYNADNPNYGNVTFDHCSAYQTVTNLGGGSYSAWYGHQNVAGHFGNVTWLSPYIYGCNVGLSGDATNVVITGGTLSNCVSAVQFVTMVNVTNLTILSSLASVNGIQVLDGPTTINASGCTIACPIPIAVQTTNVTVVNLTLCNFPVNGWVINANYVNGATTFNLLSNNLSVAANAYVLNHYSMVNYSDYNQFKSGVNFYAGDSGWGGYGTLAQWRTLTGQDAHSTP